MATAVSPFPSVFASLPPPKEAPRLIETQVLRGLAAQAQASAVAAVPRKEAPRPVGLKPGTSGQPADPEVKQAQGILKELGAGLAYAEAPEDYVVRTSTTPNGDKVRMEISVWDMKLGKLVNWTVVEGRADAIDEKMMCDSPSGAPPSSVDKALCDTVRQVREWLRQNLLPSRVQVSATSANIMQYPSIQSARFATVRQGTILKKVGEQKDWVKVILESGEVGWIYGESVK